MGGAGAHGHAWSFLNLHDQDRYCVLGRLFEIRYVFGLGLLNAWPDNVLVC